MESPVLEEAEVEGAKQVPFAIERLLLTNFRGYEKLDLNFSSAAVVFCGANGAGKTNILEAVSMLSPGRGIRGARLSELDRFDGVTSNPWTVFARVRAGDDTVEVGTARNTETESEKREVRINGQKESVTEGLARVFSCLFVSPMLDQVFSEGTSERRRFMDRLVYSFDTEHASRMNAYETAMRERNRLLKERKMNPIWLSGLEKQMASLGVAIAAARNETLERINHIMRQSEGEFPRAEIEAEGEVEALIRMEKALAAEEFVAESLAKGRVQDMEAGRTAYGIHRTDLRVFHAPKSLPVELCSTGEQKALLISVILAASRGKSLYSGISPIMLLDDIVAHLDEKRRHALFDEMRRSMNSQFFITGTDKEIYRKLESNAEFFHVEGSGKVTKF